MPGVRAGAMTKSKWGGGEAVGSRCHGGSNSKFDPDPESRLGLEPDPQQSPTPIPSPSLYQGLFSLY